MNKEDIRWKQRFQNFAHAFDQLELFLSQPKLNQLEEQGLIKTFEYTFELAWKTLQDLLKHKGYIEVLEPKPVIQQSFQDGYITDGQGWLRMQKSRNLTSHTYNQAIASEVVESIRAEYFQYLKDLAPFRN